INLGNYLDVLVRCSNYSKKDICNIINERYTLSDKPLAYTTFSNNLKDGEISLNEAIAMATIIDIDFNKIVNAYKNKY
ncbi:hypothetical protein RFZ03_22135, partial [Acinetobacter baumannii]|nr:hypothetical protein [Acinetobacter baumannii]